MLFSIHRESQLASSLRELSTNHNRELGFAMSGEEA